MFEDKNDDLIRDEPSSEDKLEESMEENPVAENPEADSSEDSKDSAEKAALSDLEDGGQVSEDPVSVEEDLILDLAEIASEEAAFVDKVEESETPEEPTEDIEAEKEEPPQAKEAPKEEEPKEEEPAAAAKEETDAEESEPPPSDSESNPEDDLDRMIDFISDRTKDLRSSLSGILSKVNVEGKQLYDISRLRLEIHALEKREQEIFAEIGEQLYQQAPSERYISPDINELFRQVEEIEEEIKQKNIQIEQSRGAEDA